VIRLPLLVCLTAWFCLCLPGQTGANAIDLKDLLKGVEKRYNRAQTLQVQFDEAYSVQGRPRKGETGRLTLRKPGRMRWDYTSPPGKLFVSDGKDVYLYTPDSNRVEKSKLKASDDMRAPLAFLLGKLDFSKEFRDFEYRPIGANVLLIAKPKSNILPYDKVEMLITPEYAIQRLMVAGQDGSILSFQFTDERLNPSVDDALFKFQMPPGATMVAAEGG
jgi:outer membrane lipoprotein carrier protein